MDGNDGKEDPNAHSQLARRDFIKGVGKFSVLTPPAVTLLLDVSMNSQAVAASGGLSGGKPAETGGKAGRGG
ncbi:MULTISPECIES: hypothetical protein [Mesorhizobium]|jgi:hypothetical protein|uniref:Uncharacterized protein n=1 Tax=Mesorhizobium opportunistum (strain LMG 24607 / HAMBI 3007 / WSM2075) TaxID=536019 RepID=F7Y8W5_MESOW|nr:MULTISPECIES: hypothetical protein [Mesorhizobium]AEH85275.1 conserved hypothetical protein [Mesorhizobium opportunistum WSM2075]MCA0029219.1 hypothetical protein [Mesorhizobium sp. B263B2A]TPN47065.1 hypothetical protein FJ976_21350 [Mesorhizobium sp. B1-1-9]TPN52343.1 hypothetical protein FJ978_12625 [Mesorhizobium sp. B1-1-7]